LRLGAAVGGDAFRGELADQSRIDGGYAQDGKHPDDDRHAPARRAGFVNVIVNRIIIQGVSVHRPVGMDVANKVSFRMGAVSGIGRAIAVIAIIRCRFGWRDERGLESERHRGRHHHDGNASTES
jgi:hypothetical protein